MDWNWYLFRFDGRINRAKLWLAGPVLLGLMMVVGLVTVAIQTLLGGPTSFHFGVEDLFKLVDPDAYSSLRWTDLPRLVVKLFGTTLFIWVYFATSIKRLHDRDKSGWWMVPFFASPASTTSLSTGFRIPMPICRSPLPRLVSACGASSRCIASRARIKPTASAPTRWHRRHLATRGRAGTSRAKSKWCRTRLARRRFGVLSGRHE